MEQKNELTKTATAEVAKTAAAPLIERVAEKSIAELVAEPAGIFDPRVYAAVMPMAKLMSEAGAAVPEWARNNPAGCFAVCVDALKWGVNPFGLIKDTASVNGGIPTYGGKATYAIIDRIVGKLHREYIGDWTKVQGKVEERTSQKGTKYYVPAWKREDEDGLAVKVWRTEADAITLTLRQCTVRNSTNWANNPMVQILYQAYKVWARVNEPGAILGFYTADEMPGADEPHEMVNITPEVVAAPASGKVAALKNRLGVGKTDTAPAMPEPPPTDASAPRRRSEIIAELIAAQGAPVTVEEVLAYLRDSGIEDIDDDAKVPLAVRHKFDADPAKAVAEMVNRMLDKGLI